ncbi:MAG: hypothetical protein LC733_04875, partial [Actinobacteria bacterium]|nr:hypothetical protein [Actinomycetota bacterium]
PWIATIMRDMIEKSATPRVKRRLESVLEDRGELDGGEVPSTVRPAITDAGLVKSVSIPQGRLRLVSRLEKELLRPASTLAHELLIAATVPESIDEAGGLECEIAVFRRVG